MPEFLTSRARHYQGCTKLSWYDIHMRYVCHNSSACHACVMWAELGHSHFNMCQLFQTTSLLFGLYTVHILHKHPLSVLSVCSSNSPPQPIKTPLPLYMPFTIQQQMAKYNAVTIIHGYLLFCYQQVAASVKLKWFGVAFEMGTKIWNHVIYFVFSIQFLSMVLLL